MKDNTESKVMPEEGTERYYDYKIAQFDKRFKKAKYDIILAELELKQIEADKMLLENMYADEQSLHGRSKPLKDPELIRSQSDFLPRKTW